MDIPSDYRQILTEFIQKQMAMLGPYVVRMKLSSIKNLQVDSDGRVQKIEGSEKQVLEEVTSKFMHLSEYAVKTAMNQVIKQHQNFPSTIPALPTQGPSEQAQTLPPSQQSAA